MPICFLVYPSLSHHACVRAGLKMAWRSLVQKVVLSCLSGGGIPKSTACRIRTENGGKIDPRRSYVTPHVEFFAFTIISSYNRNCRFITTLRNTEDAYNLKQQLDAQLATSKQCRSQGQLELVKPCRSNVLL